MPLAAAATLIGIGLVLSLGASYWVYDRSSLYDLEWSDAIEPSQHVLVAHAGFDEISESLRERLGARVDTHNFYGDLELVSASIRRAQGHGDGAERGPSVVALPLVPRRYDWIVGFLSMHELRDTDHRQSVLRALADGLAPSGRVIVVEHLRDLPNAMAFSVGFTHFLSLSSWQRDFAAAGLVVVEEKKVTPLVRQFTLARLCDTPAGG